MLFPSEETSSWAICEENGALNAVKQSFSFPLYLISFFFVVWAFAESALRVSPARFISALGLGDRLRTGGR